MSFLLVPDIDGTEPIGRFLYPRLPLEIGRGLITNYAGVGLAELRSLGETSHRAAASAPTGGIAVDPDRIAMVQAAIRRIADDARFPDPLPRNGEQVFDRPCAEALFEMMEIVPADAASEDVWTFLTLVVVPEIGPWRYPLRSEERLLGKPRNVLRRLWWRAWAFGPDLSVAPEGCTPLGEDEFVGIMERPSIGGNPRTARALRNALWRLEAEGLDVARSEVARQMARRFRAFLPYLCVEALSDPELVGLLDEIALEAVPAAREAVRLGKVKEVAKMGPAKKRKNRNRR